ncbi:4-phosphopantetheinyl transferase [Agrococcus sp. ARC_14]|uniref:4'-phosphopantetheinyl transferase family protein n=1 Tax=Agrococcus sp. ARC_14 TaxID=2919927 RepID=UPI001F067216|nr:4-phosphopantetheinyl transferase [Agrococcus sp. ARC_14]MCH1883351.1 4-phosphopantetheinyl transferase [Agrococcus sp. ARC_14]
MREVRAPGRAAGHDLLRAVVAELAGVDRASVSIVQRCPDCGGPHGRPVVMEPSAARGIGVSLAHAGEHHVVAAMTGARVGVDAEPRETSPVRLEALRALLRHDTPDPLLHWTRVEAVLKADGRGLRVEPADVLLEPTADGLTASVPGSSRRFAVHEIALDDALVVSVAIAR